jgi:hypothetical protein
MRPLKPYAIALGGLIASVFGALFFGIHPSASPAVPTNGVRANLQPKSVAPATDIVVNRDAAPEGKAPPRPEFVFLDFARSETHRLTRIFFSLALPGFRERLIDQRLRLLIGIVELRI